MQAALAAPLPVRAHPGTAAASPRHRRGPIVVAHDTSPLHVRQNKQLYRDEDYHATQQSVEREEWAKGVRAATGREKQSFWQPAALVLDPPPLLSAFTLVLLSPRRPVSAGIVARACSCFELDDLAIVSPRSNHLSRHALGASKGAQYILHRARVHDTLEEALRGTFSVAFARWVTGLEKPRVSLPQLCELPAIAQRLSATSSSAGQRVALVFGREDLGMSDAEVGACDAVCSIPIGRLQESLSLSHAVTITLSHLFQQQQQQQHAAQPAQ